MILLSCGLSILLFSCSGASLAAAPPAQNEVRNVHTVAVAPDDSLIAAGCSGGRVVLLSAADGRRLEDLEPRFTADLGALAFSPDGRQLAALAFNGTLVLWTLSENGEEARCRGAGPSEALPLRGPRGISPFFTVSMSWSPGGERLFVAGNGHRRLLRADGEPVAQWTTGRPDGVWSLDGRFLLTVDGSTVQLRDGDRGEKIVREIHCPEPVLNFELHPTGTLLAPGHVDGHLRFWDLETGETRGEIRFIDSFDPNPEDEIAEIAFSPSGKRLAYSTRMGTYLIVVDFESREQIWTSGFLGSAEVTGLRWSPRGDPLYFGLWPEKETIRCLEPEAGAQPRIIASSIMPCYGNAVGAILTKGKVRAIDTDGRPLWK